MTQVETLSHLTMALLISSAHYYRPDSDTELCNDYGVEAIVNNSGVVATPRATSDGRTLTNLTVHQDLLLLSNIITAL